MFYVLAPARNKWTSFHINELLVIFKYFDQNVGFSGSMNRVQRTDRKAFG